MNTYYDSIFAVSDEDDVLTVALSLKSSFGIEIEVLKAEEMKDIAKNAEVVFADEGIIRKLPDGNFKRVVIGRSHGGIEKLIHEGYSSVVFGAAKPIHYLVHCIKKEDRVYVDPKAAQRKRHFKDGIITVGRVTVHVEEKKVFVDGNEVFTPESFLAFMIDTYVHGKNPTSTARGTKRRFIKKHGNVF